MNEDIQVPIYLITGFLDSGKTTFTDFTLNQSYFAIDGKTLLILCEEGEVEYDRKTLLRGRAVIEVIHSEEEFTKEKLETLDLIHRPERVVIEYNGMWLVSRFNELELPDGWGVEQQITCVDASTYQIYTGNMKSQFVDMIRDTDMVIFNRCKDSDPLPSYRRAIKVVNQAAEVVFEDESGEIQDIFQESLPYDMDAPVVEILPEDYGIWFVDTHDNPKDYKGKTIHFKAKVMRSPGMRKDFFVAGRQGMVCCANDIQFLGVPCRFDKADELKNDSWVEVTGKAETAGNGEGIYLNIQDVAPCAPLAQEMVTFN